MLRQFESTDVVCTVQVVYSAAQNLYLIQRFLIHWYMDVIDPPAGILLNPCIN